MPKTYFVYLPVIKGNVEEEWKQCLRQIEDTCWKGFTPLKLNVFIDLPDFESFLKTRDVIISSVRGAFKSPQPALNVTVHPPEKPWKVAVEATFVKTGKFTMRGETYKSTPYVVIESEAGKELWAAGVSSYSHPEDTRLAAEKAFDLMVEILSKEGMTADNLVRQWNFIGKILEVKNECQNYQIFNEVRNEYYSRYRKVRGFPAATGIGMMHGEVILDFCAIVAGESTTIRAVENPYQVNAYDYAQKVLKGITDQGKTEKHAPQFERALLVTNKIGATLHISGTASILGQETIGAEDIEKQTLVTIGNIEKLNDKDRLNQLISEHNLSDGRYTLLRVYIKKQADFEVVKRICNDRYKGVPVIFIESDICRDTLLMEIEAEAFLEYNDLK